RPLGFGGIELAESYLTPRLCRQILGRIERLAAPDLITGARTRSEDMRSEVESAEGVAERDARGQRTPTFGGDGRAVPREKGCCRPVGREEGAVWGDTRLVRCDEAGRGGVHIGNYGLGCDIA